MAATSERLTNFQNSVLLIEPTARWIRGYFNGVPVVDSKHAIIVKSRGGRRGRLAYYFPAEDVRMDLLTPTDNVTNDRHIGDATHYSLTVNGKTAEDAAMVFGEPHATEEGFTDEVPDL